MSTTVNLFFCHLPTSIDNLLGVLNYQEHHHPRPSLWPWAAPLPAVDHSPSSPSHPTSHPLDKMFLSYVIQLPVAINLFFTDATSRVFSSIRKISIQHPSLRPWAAPLSAVDHSPCVCGQVGSGRLSADARTRSTIGAGDAVDGHPAADWQGNGWGGGGGRPHIKFFSIHQKFFYFIMKKMSNW